MAHILSNNFYNACHIAHIHTMQRVQRKFTAEAYFLRLEEKIKKFRTLLSLAVLEASRR
jgi:hypothetical protein